MLATVVAVAATLFPCSRVEARDSRLPVRDAADARRGAQPRPGLVPFLGIVTAEDGGALQVARVVEGSAAQRHGVRAGDRIVRLQGRPVATGADLDAALRGCAPGDVLRLSLDRNRELLDRDVPLGGRRQADPLFRGASFRLAVVPLRFADDAVEPAVAAHDLGEFFFASTGKRGAGASVRDYYAAQSRDALDVGGRVLQPVRLSGRRADYAERAMGAAAGSPFREAARLLAERSDRDTMRDVDGIAFLYDGAVESRPGRALWPHRAVVSIAGRPLPYYVHGTASVARGEIGEHCHEFGHLLGLEDMYGVAHRTGAGDFCVMAIGHRGGGSRGPAEPFSLCAWCRMRLGWLECVLVDPSTPQRLRLDPALRRGAVGLAIPLDRRTSEYLLLEVRAREGFDAALPSAGLLVWRVGGVPTPGQGPYATRVDLVEAHGIDTFDASLVRPGEIAFPTARARDLTPETVPSSRSARRGAYSVHVTDIERERSGAVVLTVGVPAAVRQAAPAPYDMPVGRVIRTDPITGEEVAFDVAAGAGPSRDDGSSRR